MGVFTLQLALAKLLSRILFQVIEDNSGIPKTPNLKNMLALHSYTASITKALGKRRSIIFALDFIVVQKGRTNRLNFFNLMLLL